MDAAHSSADEPLLSSGRRRQPTIAGFWQNSDIRARREAGVFHDLDAYRQALDQRRHEKQKMLDSLHRLNLLPNHVSRYADAIPELSGDLHNAIIGFLSSSPSMLLALNQEDLTKETRQQNLPGTTEQYPHWQRKMRYTIEELETSEEVAGFTNRFHNWLKMTGRLPRV